MWKEKEFIDKLENQGIDTVCCMGSGYRLSDVKVGATFWFTYAFMGINAKQEREEALQHVLAHWRSWATESAICTDIINNDKFKIISKYRYVTNKIFGGKRREEYVTVQNTRTKQIYQIQEDWIDAMFYCFFDTID